MPRASASYRKNPLVRKTLCKNYAKVFFYRMPHFMQESCQNVSKRLKTGHFVSFVLNIVSVCHNFDAKCFILSLFCFFVYVRNFQGSDPPKNIRELDASFMPYGEKRIRQRWMQVLCHMENLWGRARVDIRDIIRTRGSWCCVGIEIACSGIKSERYPSVFWYARIMPSESLQNIRYQRS